MIRSVVARSSALVPDTPSNTGEFAKQDVLRSGVLS